MNRLLFSIALIKHDKKIKPCCDLQYFDNRSFTRSGNKIYFWFNTDDGNTHIIKGVVR